MAWTSTCVCSWSRFSSASLCAPETKSYLSVIGSGDTGSRAKGLGLRTTGHSDLAFVPRRPPFIGSTEHSAPPCLILFPLELCPGSHCLLLQTWPSPLHKAHFPMSPSLFPWTSVPCLLMLIGLGCSYALWVCLGLSLVHACPASPVRPEAAPECVRPAPPASLPRGRMNFCGGTK